MAAFVPIYYREDGTYFIAMSVSHHASNCEEIEIVHRSAMQELILESRIKGIVAVPYISHGFS